MSPFYGIRVRKLTVSREAFVKAWRVPSLTSVFEPGEQIPERVVRRWNVRWLPPAGPSLRPDHVGPQPLSHPPTRCVRGGDERRRERKPPRSRLALEATAASPVTDEVPDLVQRDEVAHLATNRRDPDLEASLATAVAMPNGGHDGPSTPVDAVDRVCRAEVVDVVVEGLGLHRPSVVVGREVALTRPASADVRRVS